MSLKKNLKKSTYLFQILHQKVFQTKQIKIFLSILYILVLLSTLSICGCDHYSSSSTTRIIINLTSDTILVTALIPDAKIASLHPNENIELQTLEAATVAQITSPKRDKSYLTILTPG